MQRLGNYIAVLVDLTGFASWWTVDVADWYSESGRVQTPENGSLALGHVAHCTTVVRTPRVPRNFACALSSSRG